MTACEPTKLRTQAGAELHQLRSQALEKSIQEELTENNYEAYPPFVLKVVQLQETMVVRHGVMTVGQTQCGKTVCAETLKRSLLRLHNDPDIDPNKENQFYQPTTLHTMNPKAVWMEELYGTVNEVTREWTDGILSNIARKVVRNETKVLQRVAALLLPGVVLLVLLLLPLLSCRCYQCLPHPPRPELDGSQATPTTRTGNGNSLQVKVLQPYHCSHQKATKRR